MALYHLSASVVKRSAGRSAVAAAAYRSGERLEDERHGMTHDYTRKQGVAHSEIIAPENTPDWMLDRTKLWNAVEKIETRKNAQLARDLTLALPFEMSDEQRRDLVRQYVHEQFVSHGMIADVAIHAPHHKGDDRNHHAHIMLTMRELTGDGFNAKKSTPEARRWNERETLETWRTEWAAIQNREFERLGISASVDHRSLSAQGIDREPQQHEGVAATALKRRGDISHVAQENDRRAASNDNTADLHAELLAVRSQLDRIRDQQRDLVAEKQADLSAEHALSVLSLKQRQEDERDNLEENLLNHYRPHLETVTAATDAITERLENSGKIRGFLRDMTGRTRADRERLDKLQATIATTHQRMQEQKDALQKRHEQEQRQAEERFHDRRHDQERQIMDAQRESATEAATGGKSLTYAQRLALRAEQLQEKRDTLEQKTENTQKRDHGLEM